MVSNAVPGGESDALVRSAALSARARQL